MFGLKFKEPYCLKRYPYTNNDGFHHSIYRRKLDPVKEVFFTGLGSFFVCIMVDALWTLNIDIKYYYIIVLCAMIVRLLTIVEGGEDHTK